jgi:uncharacterized Zn-binding protein involved in type VI secretion
MPPAARLGDMQVCSMTTGNVPHVGGPIVMGVPTVLIGNAPAARQGDPAVCAGGPPTTINEGAASVLIGYMPAARLGDATAHHGTIVVGCPTVLIGTPAQGAALTRAAQGGAALCEECAGGG